MRLVKWLVAFTLAATGVMTAAPRVSDAADGPTFTYEVGVERGVVPAEHAAEFLAELGIPVDEQGGRLVHLYNNLAQLGLPGYAVELTAQEANKASRVAGGDADVTSFSRSWEASVGPIGVAGITTAGGQVESLALARHGMPDDLSYIVPGPGRPVIAVLDTGVDADHPDLNVLPGFNAADPGAEIIDVVGHGTFVAGVLAAKGNGFGIRGAAPGASIIPVKVLGDEASGTTADIIAGYDYVAGLVLSGQRVDVINMSLGGENPATECGTGDDLLHEAVCVLTALDVITVVAAGNADDNAVNYSPANYPEAVTVSAIADADGERGGTALMPQAGCAAGSADDALATFSNFGAIVDIAAVGVCNFGTTPTTWESPLISPYEPYGAGSGTSFSAPLVSAAIARYRAANPDQPGRVAVEQVLRYSTLYGGAFTDDPDGIAEPVLWLGAIPRWAG